MKIRTSGGAIGGLGLALGFSLILGWSPAMGQELPERARAMDTNGNGVIDRDEARGPLASNFAVIDSDKSGGIDGTELAAFFGGGGNGAAVVVDAVIEEDLSQTTSVIGALVAQQAGPVAARVSGPIDTIRVQVGDRVKRGDVLVEVSTARLQSETDRNLAMVDQNRRWWLSPKPSWRKLGKNARASKVLRGRPPFRRSDWTTSYRTLSSETATSAIERPNSRKPSNN